MSPSIPRMLAVLAPACFIGTRHAIPLGVHRSSMGKSRAQEPAALPIQSEMHALAGAINTALRNHAPEPKKGRDTLRANRNQDAPESWNQGTKTTQDLGTKSQNHSPGPSHKNVQSGLTVTWVSTRRHALIPPACHCRQVTSRVDTIGTAIPGALTPI